MLQLVPMIQFVKQVALRGETEQAVTARSCQQIAVLRIKSFVIADDIRCFVDGRLRDIFPLIVNPESLIFCLDEQTVAFIRRTGLWKGAEEVGNLVRLFFSSR